MNPLNPPWAAAYREDGLRHTHRVAQAGARPATAADEDAPLEHPTTRLLRETREALRSRHAPRAPGGHGLRQHDGLDVAMPAWLDHRDTDLDTSITLADAGGGAVQAFGLGRGQSRGQGAGTAPSIAVEMLAGFRIWVGDTALTALPHGKARALLKLLLLHRQRPLGRARLCALFWPDADPEGARNNLHVTLHRLRRALGTAASVRHSEEGYQFHADGEVWVDVEQFRLHAEMAALEEAAGRPANAMGQYEAALALHRSELMDEGEHEAALAADAQALRDSLNQVLERLAILREAAGDLHGCVRVASRHLGLDECNEEAHRRLMRCYAALGQPQLAERQFRRCVASLRQLLAMPPADETTQLYRRITERKAA